MFRHIADGASKRALGGEKSVEPRFNEGDCTVPDPNPSKGCDSSFQPFRISLTDGSSYEVRHPETAMVDPTTVHVGVPAGETRLGTMYYLVNIARKNVSKTQLIEEGTSANGK